MAQINVSNVALGNQYQLENWLEQQGQSVQNNDTSVYWEVGIRKLSGSGYWNNDASNWSANIDGNQRSGTIPSYDFRKYTYLVLASGYINVPHNADGSKTISMSSSFSTPGTIPNGTTPTGYLGLTTIPRASNITTFNPFTIGSNVPWAVDRKAASFTHWVRLSFGGQIIIDAPGQTGASGTLGITQAMKNQMLALVPSAISGTATLTVWTYNSSNQTTANQVGSPSVKTATASVGADIVPTFSGLTHSENVTNVKNLIGAYVQTKSKLNLAITGAAGVNGSTIASNGYKIVTAGTTINAVSGVSNFIIESGNIALIASVTDSRGRTTSKAFTIPVLAYESPTIEPASFLRCDANGTINPLGNYVKVSFKGSVSSLKVGTVEKNKLIYRVLSKKILDPSFAQKTDVTHSTLTFNSFIILSGYPIDYSYNLIARILDVFGDTSETSSIGMIPFGEVLQHWARKSTALGMLLPGTDKNVYVGPDGLESFGPISIGGIMVHAMGGTIVEKEKVINFERKLGAGTLLPEAIDGLIADYIIEYGFNSNGSWEKWRSGKLIQKSIIEYGSLAFTVNQGGIFTPAGGVDYDLIFPISFWGGTLRTLIFSGGIQSHAWLHNNFIYSDNTKVSCRMWSDTSRSLVSAVVVTLIAEGRWK